MFNILGIVKKVTGGVFKLIHEKKRNKNSSEEYDKEIHQLDEIYKSNPELKPNLAKSTVCYILLIYYLLFYLL